MLFKTSQVQKATGGWLNKAAALVHMLEAKDTQLLAENLRKISKHHSIQDAVRKVDKVIQREGKKGYSKFIWQLCLVMEKKECSQPFKAHVKLSASTSFLSYSFSKLKLIAFKGFSGLENSQSHFQILQD